MNTPRAISDWPRRAAVILLVSWIALGLAHTGYVMIRPHGLIIRRPPELSRTIGLPAWVEGPVVIAAADLIDGADPPDGAAILLVRPPMTLPSPGVISTSSSPTSSTRAASI